MQHGEMSMRAILFTEELMGVALKFSRKSANMGSLWVSWEPSNNNNNNHPDTSSSSSSSSSKNRKKFTRRVQTTISLCLATVFFTIFVFFVCVLDSSRASSSSSTPWPLWRSSAAPAAAADLGGRGAALQGLGVAFRRGSRSMSELVVAHVAEDLAAEELRLFLRTLHRSGVTARADVVLLFPGDPRDAGLAAVVEEEERMFKKLMLESGCIVNSGNESSAAAAVFPGSNCAEDAALLQSNCSISRLNLAAFERAQEESRLRAEAALARQQQQQQQGNVSAPLENQQQQRWMNNGVGWGSIMGFEVSELDPTDTLSGFVERPPVQLRRWVCYHMLLGMARHRYKQVMVTQVRGVFVLGDGLLAMARKHKDGRALVLVAEDRTWLEEASMGRRSSPNSRREILSKAEEEEEENEVLVQDDPEAVENWGSTGTITTRRSSDSTSDSGSRKKRRKRSGPKPGMIEAVYGKQVWSSIEREDKAGWSLVSGAVVAGGVRGLRSLADAVATEVARVAMMRRSRRAFGDQAVLNYVVRRNAGVLGRKVVEKMIVVGGGADAPAQALLPSGGGSAAERILEQLGSGGAQYSVVIAGDSDEELRLRIGKMVAEDLCSSPRESAVYRDCEQQQEQLVV